MSLLFGSGRRLVPVAFSEESNTDGGILLGQDVWDSLLSDGVHQPSSQDTNATRVFVVIEPIAGPSREATSGLSKLIEWASLDSNVSHPPASGWDSVLLTAFFRSQGRSFPEYGLTNILDYSLTLTAPLLFENERTK